MIKTKTSKIFMVLACIFCVFSIYTLITAVVYKHRLENITTHYSMPDVDTDAGFWYQWYLSYIHKNGLVYDVTNTEAFPIGYDISIAPLKNLVYTTHVFVLNNVLGYSWQNLILVNNVSTLLVYPLASTFAFLLIWYLTKSRFAGFFAGTIYGFSFYVVFMGRGEMSINHIELIPLYFLFLFYYLDTKKNSALVASLLVYSVLFRMDAYYAFWSGMFSLILHIFYKPQSIKTTLLRILKYYLLLGLTLFLMNLDFISSQLPTMLNKEKLIQTGRNSNPMGELTSILYYLSIPIHKVNRLTEFLGSLSYLFNIPLLASVTLLYVRKKRLYTLFFGCFLLAVVLSAYIPGFYEVNLLYFKYFGMFRGVGRLAMFAAMFLSILTGYAIAELIRSKLFIRLPKPKYLAIAVVFIAVLLSNLNNDATWLRTTDMSRIHKLYSDIPGLNNSRGVASYPVSLGSGDVGFPQPYELIGQIIHEKPLAAGLSQFATTQQTEYQDKIKNIEIPSTIDTLAQRGIDTIFIRDRMLNNSLMVNNKLMKDPRLTYIGFFSVPNDEKSGKTNNDRARALSVYRINENLLPSRNENIIYNPTTNKKLEYRKVNPYMYVIGPITTGEVDTIALNFPYSDKWGVYGGDLSSKRNLLMLFEKVNDQFEHTSDNLDGNVWKFTKGNNALESYQTLFFKSGAVYDLDMIFALLAITTLSLCYILFVLKEKKEKHDAK